MSNAIDWAEKTLGLTALKDECDTEQDVLDDLASHLDKAADDKRVIGDKVKDRETQLLIEERGKHPDQSQAWLDRHMVEAKYKDPELVVLRQEYQAASSVLSGLEYDWEVQKSKVRILSNRMIQNGGYLNFLAAAKIGEIATGLVQVAPSLISAAAQTLKTLTATENKSDTEPSGNTAG